jgi:hypothetical protein
MEGRGVLCDDKEVSSGLFKDSVLNGAGIKAEIDGKYAMKGEFRNGVLSGDKS